MVDEWFQLSRGSGDAENLFLSALIDYMAKRLHV
jgi:hypothetical protein